MTCNVRDCSAISATPFDLDPDKVGGWSSYSYEVLLCELHRNAITAGVPWVCRDVEGASGWVVLVGGQLTELNKFVVEDAPRSFTSGELSWRSNALPSKNIIRLKAHQIGRASAENLDLYITAEQARNLIVALELYIEHAPDASGPIE